VFDQSVVAVVFADDVKSNTRSGLFVEATKVEGKVKIQIVPALSREAENLEAVEGGVGKEIDRQLFAARTAEEKNALVPGENQRFQIRYVFMVDKCPDAHGDTQSKTFNLRNAKMELLAQWELERSQADQGDFSRTRLRYAWVFALYATPAHDAVASRRKTQRLPRRTRADVQDLQDWHGKSSFIHNHEILTSS